MTFKNDDKYERIARICQALSNPARLKILEILIANCTCSASGCCVSDINNQVNLPQPYVSKHLKVLKDCGILAYHRDANKIYYSFQMNKVWDEIIEYLNLGKCCSIDCSK